MCRAWKEYEREKGKETSKKKGRGGERTRERGHITKLGEAKTSQKRKSNISVERPIECQCESNWI